ncbi:hypothetical protein [Streptomyces sp. NPDC059802]|uniref:hypothetical protein n=1 Tax=Streptomyces sp. NPDC059802 TaxID=3346952 RepID=UPI003660FE34
MTTALVIIRAETGPARGHAGPGEQPWHRRARRTALSEVGGIMGLMNDQYGSDQGPVRDEDAYEHQG